MNAYIDTLMADFIIDFDLIKKRYIASMEHVKLKFIEEHEKVKQLEAEKRTLAEKLAAKDEAILLLTDGVDRINKSEEKESTIKKLEAEIVNLKRQLELSADVSTPESDRSLKRKRIITKVLFPCKSTVENENAKLHQQQGNTYLVNLQDKTVIDLTNTQETAIEIETKTRIDLARTPDMQFQQQKRALPQQPNNSPVCLNLFIKEPSPNDIIS